MASAPEKSTRLQSLFPGDGKPPYVHLRESTTTFSRPMGTNELFYNLIRGPRGYLDSFSIVPLACSGEHTTTDDEVVQAYAALRLRHPLLASKVAYSTTQLPELVYTSPLTQAHALREARAQIEFHAFHDQGTSTEALHDHWFSVKPEDALDLRNGTCSLYWGRDIDTRSGKYILGLMTPHFITDGRCRLNLVRCMLELLASPGRAQRELAAHFAGKTPIVGIPPALNDLCPSMDDTSPSELAKAKAAFDDLVKFRSKPLSGLVPDVPISEDDPQPRFVRQTWSTDDTTRILKACKAQGVTITHLASVAGAFASVQRPRAAHVNEGFSDEDSYYFECLSALDLNTKVPRVTSNGEMETATRLIMYPVVMSVPRAAALESTGSDALWDAARQYKKRSDTFVNSPYFWHFCRFYDARIEDENYVYRAQMMPGKPILPYMSSLGNLKSVLPVRYPIQTAHVNGNTNGTASHSAEIRILDQISSGKADPRVANFLMYTFDDRLNLQFKWDACRTSDGLIDSWFSRIVEIISQVADEGAT
ncbi:uncharacterized protein C8Q71DRAFT_735522 [Rhodofomes roseus]|uniref:Condensation domain-containing protein n=1 Tax=Rhodofomes roseus TaxID=34475 RepID=A0ABQ8KVE9_9APHY|nr:uncharacterized protein C8Q71DRAFT_735522 [Rhodofomes roseus]KAH9843003.1 hypothetical protein C8Q71DRAFT_735522 [Rhodofomes roseus]